MLRTTPAVHPSEVMCRVTDKPLFLNGAVNLHAGKLGYPAILAVNDLVWSAEKTPPEQRS